MCIEDSGDSAADSDDYYSEGSQYFYDVDGTMLKNRGIVIPSNTTIFNENHIYFKKYLSI